MLFPAFMITLKIASFLEYVIENAYHLIYQSRIAIYIVSLSLIDKYGICSYVSSIWKKLKWHLGKYAKAPTDLIVK